MKGTIVKAGCILAGAVVLGLVLFFLFFVSLVDKHELGYTYDRLTGKIEKVERNGWIVRMPFRYTVHAIDLRPYQVQISANQRILNAKLVRFNPEGLDTFISWHGRSAGDDLDNLREILKCYAFDRMEGKDCPFLTVVSVLSPDQGVIVAKPEASK